MGFGLAVMRYSYVVVPQAIILCWAAAQKWTQPFHTYLPLYLGWLRPPYQILSKSDKKQRSYGPYWFLTKSRICTKRWNRNIPRFDIFFCSLATPHCRQLGFRVKVRLRFSRRFPLPTAHSPLSTEELISGKEETAIINLGPWKALVKGGVLFWRHSHSFVTTNFPKYLHEFSNLRWFYFSLY